VDGCRLKNAEKQVVPEALDLHILTRDHAEIWQQNGQSPAEKQSSFRGV
jgi:hypothetical protein